METVQTFRIDFRSGVPKVESDRPRAPSAHIALRGWSEDKNGNIFVSPDCVSAAELEFNVNLLKQDLDALVKQAKRIFSVESKKKMRWRERREQHE